MKLEILYHDDHYIAINKPAGLLVHRSPIDRHETRFALQMLRDQIGQRVYPVHRLDKPTSGILLFGLTAEAAGTLHQGFSSETVDKQYLAVVRGHTPAHLVIDHPVKAVDDKYDMSAPGMPRESQTILRTLAQCELPFAVEKYPSSRYSLVALTPITGRRHQLRYHMKHIAHPIIGDAKYGRSAHNRFFQHQFASQRLLLAATDLRFVQPYTQQAIHIKAALPDDFMQVMDGLAWRTLLTAEGYCCAH